MINISLLENKITQKGISNQFEIKKMQIKKPKSLSEFQKFLLSEFNINNPKFIRIYSIDWNGEANEIKDEVDYEEEDNIGFKCIYNKDNPILENEIEENDSFDSIKDDELKLLLDKELNDEKKEKHKFNSKKFSSILFSKFLESQKDMLNKTKLKIDNDIEKIMIEKSEIFSDLKKIPKIKESIINTKKIISKSAIEKKNININKIENKIINNNNKNDNIYNINNIYIEYKDREKKEEYDFKFLNKPIKLEKTKKQAKWIQIDNIQFQNIGSSTFTGGDLYFFKGEGSSEEFIFAENIKNEIQYISLVDDLNPSNISKKLSIIIRNKGPLKEDNYYFNLYLKSEKKEIKMKSPLRIIIKVIKDNEEKEIEDKIQNIFEKLEDLYYITSFKTEEEVKAKILELNFDEDKINEWVKSIYL